MRAMGNKTTTASVLYAPPADDLGILQRFCEGVRNLFVSAGLIVDEGRPLLLHATLVNTVHVKDGGRGGGAKEEGRSKKGKRRWDKLEVNATALIERYDGYVWLADLPLDRLAICKMGAKAVPGAEGEEPDAAYEVEAEVQF